VIFFSAIWLNYTTKKIGVGNFCSKEICLCHLAQLTLKTICFAENICFPQKLFSAKKNSKKLAVTILLVCNTFEEIITCLLQHLDKAGQVLIGRSLTFTFAQHSTSTRDYS
jgi:hypothetical protein